MPVEQVPTKPKREVITAQISEELEMAVAVPLQGCAQ